MRVSIIHIILLVCLFVGLTGCQDQNSSNLPTNEVSQLRMIVPGGGYYQITRKEWEKNGLTVHDLDHLHLLYQGEQYPYWTNAETDSNDLAIRFYSPPISPGINLSENVFILSNGQTESNRHITPQKLSPDQNNFQNSSTGIYREKYEQNSLYLPQITREDHWLWVLFHPGQSIEQEIQIPQDSVDNLMMRIQVWVSPTNVENLVQIFTASINDHVIDPIRIEGQGWQVIEFPIEPAYVNTKNNFSFRPVISPDDPPGKIYLDWIEIEYSLPVNLGAKIQSFTIPAGQLVTSTNSIYGTLVAVDKNEQQLDVYPLQSGDPFMLLNQSDTIYTWIPDDQFLPISSIQLIQKEEQLLHSQPIDYLIIAPKKFHHALTPLIDLRQGQGFATMIVSPQQIYDSFNAGTPSADSIQKFIQRINENDPGKLEYLLLVGDYTYEIVDYQEFMGNVPSFLITTGQSGQTISDFPYADPTGDGLPDLSVGRIPATIPEQVTAWVEKVILYERSIPSDWNQIITISDPSDANFLDSAQKFLHPLSDDYQTKLFNSPDPDEIQEIFKSPYALVGYFGHGSIDLWGKDKLLSIPMLSELPKSPAPPVLISFSCLNGYFIHPEKISLAEGLLFYPGGGAIGILAPSGQTLMEDQEKLAQFFEKKLRLKNHSRIGNFIHPLVGEEFPENSSITDIFKTYIFFGDPAMIIPKSTR